MNGLALMESWCSFDSNNCILACMQQHQPWQSFPTSLSWYPTLSDTPSWIHDAVLSVFNVSRDISWLVSPQLTLLSHLSSLPLLAFLLSPFSPPLSHLTHLFPLSPLPARVRSDKWISHTRSVSVMFSLEVRYRLSKCSRRPDRDTQWDQRPRPLSGLISNDGTGVSLQTHTHTHTAVWVAYLNPWWVSLCSEPTLNPLQSEVWLGSKNISEEERESEKESEREICLPLSWFDRLVQIMAFVVICD